MDAVTTVWICINLVGAVCVNLGQNVMKLGHNKRAEMDLPEEEKPAIRTIRQWQIGVVVFVGGGVANFVSFGYAPQSLLSALGSIQFVSNVVFASLVLKEKVTIRVVFATACIVGGCILIVVFSASSQEILTVEELMSYYQSPAYITYICLMFVLMIGCYLVYRYGKRVTSSPDGHVPAFWNRLLPISYAMFCAPIGTQSVLFSKTVSVLLRTTMSGDSQLGSWFTWVMLLAFILTAVFWVTRLNKSLKLFPAIVIVPTMQIGWTIFSIISGGIYFQEFQEYGPLAMSMFLLGVSIIMVGVFYLTPPPKAASDRYVDMDIDDSTRNLTMASPQSSRSHRGRGRSDADDDGMQEPLSPRSSPHGGSHAKMDMQLQHDVSELKSEDKAETHSHHHQHHHHQQGQAGQGQHQPVMPVSSPRETEALLFPSPSSLSPVPFSLPPFLCGACPGQGAAYHPSMTSLQELLLHPSSLSARLLPPPLVPPSPRPLSPLSNSSSPCPFSLSAMLMLLTSFPGLSVPPSPSGGRVAAKEEMAPLAPLSPFSVALALFRGPLLLPSLSSCWARPEAPSSLFFRGRSAPPWATRGRRNGQAPPPA